MKQSRPMSHSSYMAFNQCARKYYFRYIAGIETNAISVNLLFGKVLDRLVSLFITEILKGKYIDVTSQLYPIWSEVFTKDMEVDWGKRYTEKDFYDMLVIFANNIPQYWKESGLVPLKSVDGQPLVQWGIHHILDGIEMYSILDLVAFSPLLGKPVVIDVKTAATPADEEWTADAEQLHIYANAASQDPRIPYDNFEYGGFWEFIKRKPNGRKGPEAIPPKPVLLRDTSRQELPARMRITQDRINREEFMAQPAMAFNTPCTMCEYADLCRHSRTDNLKRRI